MTSSTYKWLDLLPSSWISIFPPILVPVRIPMAAASSDLLPKTLIFRQRRGEHYISRLKLPKNGYRRVTEKAGQLVCVWPSRSQVMASIVFSINVRFRSLGSTSTGIYSSGFVTLLILILIFDISSNFFFQLDIYHISSSVIVS